LHHPQSSASAEDYLFAATEPFDSDRIQVSPLHHVYYEQCGNPQGVPIVFLHGGPGGGCTPKQRRFFDPDYYRIVLFDQRGCGRSLPLGDVVDNTTWHLIEDIETLRKQLGVEQWFVFGGSWGSTLALAYAANHPNRVRGLILRGIFLARPAELDWFLYKVGNFFPEAYARLIAPLLPSEQDDILSAYQQRVFNEDAATSLSAAHSWNAYEASILSLLPATAPPSPVAPTPDEILLARARVQLHYLINDCFLQQHPLLSLVNQLRALPSIIVQGRYDMVCPPATAYALHQAWPEAQYIVAPDAGHSAMEPGIAAALVEATESFKSLGR
jgi:proline iminopeptidase